MNLLSPFRRITFAFCFVLTMQFAYGPVRASAESTSYTGKKISIDLNRSSIQSAIRILAEVSGYNVVLHPDVHGDVTLRHEAVPWDQVLELILRMHGLYQIREGNVILIVPYGKVPESF